MSSESADFLIEQFGPHSVQVDIDGKQAGDIPFRAVHADA